jgi:hypothetical protein
VSQRSSFIFNSNRILGRRAKPIIFLIVWALLGLLAIDVSINFLFAYPKDSKFLSPSRFQLYFEYGRSVEGKLSRMTRQNQAETAPITLSGWYDPLKITLTKITKKGDVEYTEVTEEEKFAKSDTLIVTFYGASHTGYLGIALRRISDRFFPRIVVAPASTGNWAYGAYLRDRGGGKSHAVVLGFTSANFAMISSFSPMIWNVDFPMPYTADRFYLEGNRLRVIHPPYTSFEQYVNAFYSPTRWSTALAFFAANDPFYDSFIMRASVLDYSSLWRLVRRAHGQTLVRNLQKSSLDQSGFRSDSEQVKVARAIIHEFAVQARNDGMIPVIYVVNNLGYSDNLLRALRPVLEADNIPYVSSDAVVSPYDSRGYTPDGHFTDDEDNRLAAKLVEIIKNGR